MLIDLRRLLVLSTALMVSHVATRDGDDSEDSLTHYVRIGLLTQNELRQLR